MSSLFATKAANDSASAGASEVDKSAWMTNETLMKMMQLLLVFTMDGIVKLVTVSYAWIKTKVEFHLFGITQVPTETNCETNMRKFKFDMELENDGDYTRLLIAELARSTMSNEKHYTTVGILKYESYNFTHLQSKGVEEYLRIGRPQIIRLHKISYSQYIWCSYLNNRFHLLCNTKNTDMVNYLNALHDIHSDKMKLNFKPSCLINSKLVEMNTTITFDRLFLENKQEIVSVLNRFKDVDYYQKRSIPHHLGILIYGDPGTGKTSFVKAMAVHMRKNICIVDCGKIKTKKDFDLLVGVNLDKILLLEDFDRLPSVLVKEESKTSTTSTMETDNKSLKTKLMISYSESKSPEEKEKLQKMIDLAEDDNLDLPYLLNFLDGVVETPGRAIVFSANFPERIHPALLRCGRIDHKFHFKRTNRRVIAQILNYFFVTASATNNVDNADIDKLPDTSRIPNYKYTHSEVYALAKKYDDLDKVIKILESGNVNLETIETNDNGNDEKERL